MGMRRLILITLCGILLKAAPVPTLSVQTCEGGDIKEVSVKRGQTLLLLPGCNETADASDWIIWSLLPENDVLVNYADGKSKETQETPRRISELKKRIHFKCDSGSLKIEDVCIDDTHLYYGQVHKKSRSYHCKFNVTVFDPVSTPLIKPNASSVDDSCQSLTVQCSVENGRDVTLSWFRGEERLNQTSSPDLSTNLSLLLDIKDQDGDHSYTCKVENPVDEAVSELHIEETCLRNKGPPVVHVYAKESKNPTTIILHCLATGLYPKDVVTLDIKRNGRVLDELDGIQSTDVRPNGDGTYQNEKHVEILRSDSSKFSCEVKHAASNMHVAKDWDPDPQPGADWNFHPALPWVIGVVLFLFLCLLATYILFKQKWNIGEVNNQEGTRRVRGSGGTSGDQPEQPGMPLLDKVVVVGEKQTGEPIQPPADAGKGEATQ